MPLPRHPLLGCSLLCAIALAVSLPEASAQERAGGERSGERGARERSGDDGRRAPRQRQQDALSDAVRRVERRTRGQVLSAERVPYDGRDINRIKVVDDRGRVRVYMDDPQQPARVPPTRDDDD